MATIPNLTHTVQVAIDLGGADSRLYHPTLNVKQVQMTKSVEETGESWVPRLNTSANDFRWGISHGYSNYSWKFFTYRTCCT